MNYGNIPKEIQQLNQWVCAWNTSKCPMRISEKKSASSTNEATWGSFEQAVLAVKDGEYDHIGFVFNNNGIVGIDIDVGFEDGLLTPLCADIMKHCQSYTEKSKSGRGVHILLHGNLPFDGKNNRKGVEIYKTGRYFITTGDVLLFDTIRENQEAIDYVVATYFAEAQSDPKKGKPLVEKIYSPEWPRPKRGKVALHPTYPAIGQGGRNVSLLSLAGALWTMGYSKRDLYTELMRANREACKPPLSTSEVESICSSIYKYKRGEEE